MEKIIWVIGNNRQEMLEVQRSVNSMGSMRALCMLTTAALERAIQGRQANRDSRMGAPSLILADYETLESEDFASLSLLKNQPSLAGVPVFFMVTERTNEIDEKCFSLGAMVVLCKPFSRSSILRIEHMAWQQEVTKNYEKTLQKQANDLQVAREIVRLNKQLESRNELLHQVFGRYFSDEVLEMILEHPEEVAIGGVKRELTVMMTDLRGFTALSEELTPEAVTNLLNFYFGTMVDVITCYHGTVIEFLGDGVLAVFGALLPSKEQTADAVAAAIQMQNAMSEVNEYCKKHNYPQLEMGIGIHYGEAFIGNVGSEKMMRYNVIGRVVNECSRIEGCSVGGQVLVSSGTLKNITCPVDAKKPIQIMAKGIREPIYFSEVTGIGGDYQCYLKSGQLHLMKPVEEQVVVNLCRIEGKQVDAKVVPAWLSQFSVKRALITLLEEKVDLYSDVEVSATYRDGQPIFNGVYAKVMEQNGNEVILHFTHVNQEFREYAKHVLGNVEEG